jgi:hypothetical protein
MKSLKEFKEEPISLDEDKSDYTKFDMLVRAGLANKSQLARLHRILDKMKEERPVFNPTDRAILQYLFNKMVGIITDNKQIFQRTRQAVREETEDHIVEEESKVKRGDPPVMLLLKRKAIRIYPDQTKVALYYNSKLNKHFTVPYGDGIDSTIQAEEVQLEEAVMDTLHKIVSGKQAQSVKFANGQTRKVDHYTASAITQVHKAVNDDNKKKLADMVHKSPTHFEKVSSFAFSKVK